MKQIHNKYRYALSLTSQFYFCGIPLRLDTTPKCTLNCLYCFAMSRGGRRTSRSLVANPDSISLKLRQSLECKDTKNDIIGEMLSRKMPIHFGGMSDPFSNADISSVSREILHDFSLYHYPVIVSTKNTQALMDPKTMKIIKNMTNIAIQISFTSLEFEKARIVEPNVPSVLKRINAIKELADNGVHVIARLQPLFPCSEWIAADDLIPKLGKAGCKHVAVEYLKLPVEKHLSQINKMFKAIHWDGYYYYHRNGAKLIGREWILPIEYKWDKIQILIDSIHGNNMTYGSADYGLYHMGDTGCCCGIDNLPGFRNWFDGNISNAIKRSNSQDIYFDLVKKNWFPTGSARMYINSHSRLEAHNDIFSYIRERWNSPGTVNAPDCYSGIVWNGKRDEQGDCIYHKKEFR
jgi:DNA repair photolyase